MTIRSNSELLGTYALNPMCFTQSQATHSIDNYIKKRCSQLLQCEKEALQTMDGRKTEELTAIKKTMGNLFIASNTSAWIHIALFVATIALLIFIASNPLALASGVLALGICMGPGIIAGVVSLTCSYKLMDIFEKHIQDFLADYIQNRNEDEAVPLLNQKN